MELFTFRINYNLIHYKEENNNDNDAITNYIISVFNNLLAPNIEISNEIKAYFLLTLNKEGNKSGL